MLFQPLSKSCITSYNLWIGVISELVYNNIQIGVINDTWMEGRLGLRDDVSGILTRPPFDCRFSSIGRGKWGWWEECPTLAVPLLSPQLLQSTSGTHSSYSTPTAKKIIRQKSTSIYWGFVKKSNGKKHPKLDRKKTPTERNPHLTVKEI